MRQACSELLVAKPQSHGLAGLMWLGLMGVILAPSRAIAVACLRGRFAVGGKRRRCPWYVLWCRRFQSQIVLDLALAFSQVRVFCDHSHGVSSRAP